MGTIMGMISQPTEFSSRLFLCLSASKHLVHNAGLTFLHENSSCMEKAFTNKGAPRIPVAAYYIYNSVSKLPLLWAFFEVRTIPSDLAPRQLILYFLSVFRQKETALSCLQLKYRHKGKSLIADTDVAALIKHFFSQKSLCMWDVTVAT